jgi:hypothetical protein
VNVKVFLIDGAMIIYFGLHLNYHFDYEINEQRWEIVNDNVDVYLHCHQ